MSGLLKQIEEERKKRIIATGTSYNERAVYCPYCAEEQESWEWNIQPNEQEAEVQCQKCDRHFMVSACVRYSTRRLK